MIRIKSHVFRGKRYKLDWKPVSKADKRKMKLNAIASCDGPETPGKCITINPELSGFDLLRVSVDEGIHACMWDLDNLAVDEMSESIAKFLWRMGFRDAK